MYLSQVFMKQGRFLSLPKTSFLSFNGTTSYGELATPWVSTDGNWIAEIVFEGVAQTWAYFLDGDSTGTDRQYIGYDGLSNSVFSAKCSAKLDGVSLTNTVSPLPVDGKLHTIELTGISPVSVGHIASQYAQVNYYDGIIKSVKLTDLTTPANSRTYTLNSGSDLYELPDGVSGNETHSLALLYQNVSTSDWDNYYFDRCLGDNGGWVNKADSGDIIYNA